MSALESESAIQLQRDRQLVKAILAGDERALRTFVDNYFPRLYRYARPRLRIEADVDDVVQIVLSQAARRLETYRGEASLLTWLIQICRHEISRQLRKTGRDAQVEFASRVKCKLHVTASKVCIKHSSGAVVLAY